MRKSVNGKDLVLARVLLREVIRVGEISSLINELRMHHLDTVEHSFRVAEYAAALARVRGHDSSNIMQAAGGGLCHDFGKKLVKESILNKNADLDQVELEEIHGHPRAAFIILDRILHGHPFLDKVPKIAVSHHEYKELPYPRNGSDRRQSCNWPFLKQYKAIRVGERRQATPDDLKDLNMIVSVADMYDAIRSKRSYKPALDADVAEAVLEQKFKGDPRLITQICSIKSLR